ncbi:MAG: hypothetical protein ACI93V_000706 [Alteromonadaceae bacterium]|jgi:hypothetical protein|tara:strand:+ start:4372 stop:4572 length:201 start_codon:yes stop_codon:yes gene_type:complete
MELAKLIAVVIISTLIYGCGETKTADTHIAKVNEYKDDNQTNKNLHGLMAKITFNRFIVASLLGEI